MNIVLVVEKEKMIDRWFPLDKPLIRLGRNSKYNDICLLDQKVSRFHAVFLQQSSGDYILRDLSSTNGIEYKKQKIFQKTLEVEDKFKIGNLDLKIISIETLFDKLSSSKNYVSELTDQKYPLKDVDNSLTGPIKVKTSSNSLIKKLPKELRILYEEIEIYLNGLNQQEILLKIKNLLNEKLSILIEIFKGDLSLPQRKSLIIDSSGYLPFSTQIKENLLANDHHIEDGTLYLALNKTDKIVNYLVVKKKSQKKFEEKENEFIFLKLLGKQIEDFLDRDNKDESLVGCSDFIEWPYLIIDSKFNEQLQTKAQTTKNIFLRGETGVGKSFIAYYLYQVWEQKNNKTPHSFKDFNEKNVVFCTQIPETTAESTLFGERKGAHNMADRDRDGRVQYAAKNGCVFFDEIGDLDIKIQLKLLQLIQFRVVIRMGEKEGRTLNTNVIAATNQDIEKKIETGEFREDLSYRLGEPLVIPPLRERNKDIPLLAHFFLDKVALEDTFVKNRGISNEVIKLFLEYSWPGNIRELETVVSEAFRKCRGIIQLRDLSVVFLKKVKKDKNPNANDGKDKSLKSQIPTEKESIEKALRGSKTKNEAREILGIKSRQTFLDKMKKYGIPDDILGSDIKKI